MAQGAHATDGAWVGRPLKRREDHRLLTGSGRYVDDLAPSGCAHVVLLRSPHAHARISKLDVESALRAPGVLAIDQVVGRRRDRGAHGGSGRLTWEVGITRSRAGGHGRMAG